LPITVSPRFRWLATKELPVVSPVASPVSSQCGSPIFQPQCGLTVLSVYCPVNFTVGAFPDQHQWVLPCRALCRFTSRVSYSLLQNPPTSYYILRRRGHSAIHLRARSIEHDRDLEGGVKSATPAPWRKLEVIRHPEYLTGHVYDT
jgi:hypothetical protein